MLVENETKRSRTLPTIPPLLTHILPHFVRLLRYPQRLKVNLTNYFAFLFNPKCPQTTKDRHRNLAPPKCITQHNRTRILKRPRHRNPIQNFRLRIWIQLLHMEVHLRDMPPRRDNHKFSVAAHRKFPEGLEESQIPADE